ncbi:MAG: disulfide bond formation protein B [Woeseia sp.]
MPALNPRLLNFSGFLACVMMMAYALYAEYGLLLEPCPLCIFQRVATISLGVVFLLAALHNPSGVGRRVYAVLCLLAAGGGLAVAGRHIWLQNLPADEVPACGPGLDYIIDAFPLSDALKMIFTGSGECATIDWHFLGLTMPAWVAISFTVLLALGMYANLKPQRT